MFVSEAKTSSLVCDANHDLSDVLLAREELVRVDYLVEAVYAIDDWLDFARIARTSKILEPSTWYRSVRA